MGVGMIWVVNQEDVNKVLELTDGYLIGETVAGNKEVELV